MRKLVFKCLVMSLFLIVPLLGAGPVAGAATAGAPYGTLLVGAVCGCCPQSCGGGTLIGCYNLVTMPPNAVTCVYTNSGGGPGCVSCLNAATSTDTTTAALNAIFEEARPAVSVMIERTMP